MTTTEMTFSVRMQLNALDSSRYRHFKQPHIDWALNEAQSVFIQSVVDPRVRGALKVEAGQRSIDDLREIVVNQKPSEAIVTQVFDESSVAGSIPKNYLHFLRGFANTKKGDCTKRVRIFQAQMDDEFEEDPFTKSSFEWEEVNFHFLQGGLIRLYHDKTFQISSVVMDYLRQPAYIHAAKNFSDGKYKTVNGQELTGEQNCELAVHSHPDIVQIAVAILTNSLRISDYSAKIAQLDKFYNV